MPKDKLLRTLAVFGALLILGWIYLSAHTRALRRAYCSGIVGQLIKTTNSPDLVFVGPDLTSRLSQFLASPARVEKVAHGDGGFGDSMTKIYFILVNSRGDRMGIRLRPDDTLNSFQAAGKYHVVGFWTLDPSPASASPP